MNWIKIHNETEIKNEKFRIYYSFYSKNCDYWFDVVVVLDKTLETGYYCDMKFLFYKDDIQITEDEFCENVGLCELYDIEDEAILIYENWYANK